jgi:RNA polymerase sigma-70 factor (ECF subfamily)
MATTPVDPPTGASPRRPAIDTRPGAGSMPGSVTHVAVAGGTADELEIVRAVLAGDGDAFRILVERESASVIRACHRVLADLHEAEDVAQEAFVSAYRALSTWRGEGPFGAWVTRIAVRLAVRQVGRRRAVTWLGPGGEGAGGAEAALANVPASLRVQPEHAVIRAERAAAARRAVATLVEPYREVVALRFFGECSLEEIATLTGRPLSTVKTHLRRGLLRLRDGLEPGVLP